MPNIFWALDKNVYFDDHRNMSDSQSRSVEEIAAAFAALGQPSRLNIVRLLLSAHPQGLPAGEIQRELGITASTLSHHLDKLRQVGLVQAEKDRQWIWYSVQSDALKYLIDFLFEECCTRNRVVDPETFELTDVAEPLPCPDRPD
ncbi:metalloregulator ArsR/SmtB family transcription factor [Leptothoe sp. ISB3NOV94-8A]|nr:metalloregulator ArsR/SmtB family transcription factor [Adonisia turfae]MDV3348708.1 metalloregulator ArsR/SmtB family transcription factor [Leptothoe sp. LEGE 181152]